MGWHRRNTKCLWPVCASEPSPLRDSWGKGDSHPYGEEALRVELLQLPGRANRAGWNGLSDHSASSPGFPSPSPPTRAPYKDSSLPYTPLNPGLMDLHSYKLGESAVLQPHPVTTS